MLLPETILMQKSKICLNIRTEFNLLFSEHIKQTKTMSISIDQFLKLTAVCCCVMLIIAAIISFSSNFIYLNRVILNVYYMSGNIDIHLLLKHACWLICSSYFVRIFGVMLVCAEWKIVYINNNFLLLSNIFGRGIFCFL